MARWSVLFLLLLLENGVDAAKGEPPRIDEQAQTKFRVPIGTKQFKLICPVLPSEQNVMMQWSRNGETMDFDDQYKITRDNREVRMKNLKAEDSGRYECQVINGFGHKTIEFILQVYDPATDVLSVGDRITMAEHSSPPYWLDDNEMHSATSQPKRIHIGGKLELKCAAKGNPVPELRWFKNDQLLPQNGPIDSAILTVDGVREEDGGSYRCEVANKLGYKQATFKVVVADFFDADNGAVTMNEIGPIPIIDHPYNISVQIGRTSQFMCKAKAEDTPLTKVLIRWLKELTAEEKERLQRTNATVVQANGKSLMVIDERQFPGKETVGGQNYFTNRLIIPSTEITDQGRYICVVTDTGGRIVYRTAELYVESGLMIGDLHLSSSAFWWIAIPLTLLVILFVIFGVMYLRMTQKVEVKEGKGQPPPPRIPPPITPSQDQIFPQQHNMHHPSHYFDQPQSPLLLQNTMFQPSRGTMDRLHTPHRLHRGIREEEMLGSPHFHHASPQSSPMYWGNSKSSNQPLLMAAPPQMNPHMIDHSMERGDHRMGAGHHTMGPYFHSPHHPPYAPSSNYRTLDMNYCRDPHPSLYSSDYGDHSPFINVSRTHDL